MMLEPLASRCAVGSRASQERARSHSTARVSRLVWICCGAGIEDRGEQAQRRASDEARARELEHGPFEDFIERWRTQPLFAQDPPEVGRLAREDQRRNRPDALAAVMRGIGAGAIPNAAIEILPGGHGLLLEQPEAVASALEPLLDP